MYVDRPNKTIADLIAENPDNEELIREAHSTGYQRAMWNHRNKPKKVTYNGDKDNAECALVVEYTRDITVTWTTREGAEEMVSNMAGAVQLDVQIMDIPAEGEELNLPAYADLNEDNHHRNTSSYTASITDENDPMNMVIIAAGMGSGMVISQGYSDKEIVVPVSKIPEFMSYLVDVYEMYSRNSDDNPRVHTR